MWNTGTSTESGENAIAENHILAGTSDYQTNPSFVKRQRRPNVRLEELGDLHASPAADKRKKKTGKSLGRLHKRSVFNNGDDAQQADNALLCCLNGPAGRPPAIKKSTKLQHILKTTGKKVGNGGRRRGVSTVAAPVKDLPRVPQSGTSIRADCKQKVSHMHFDKENDAHTPTRFEASRYHDGISPSERRERGDMVLLHAHQNYQSGEFLPARVQGREERANQWNQAFSMMHAFKLTDDADGKRMSHTNGSLHVPKGKLVVKKAYGSMHGTRNIHVGEANGNEHSREASKKNAVRQCCQPWLGVREWLQDLGLGKYAQLFEAHEVEPEVLPLLTLDDLREMGVAAVGSRRKIFYAIQHIRKALLAERE